MMSLGVNRIAYYLKVKETLHPSIQANSLASFSSQGKDSGVAKVYVRLYLIYIFYRSISTCKPKETSSALRSKTEFSKLAVQNIAPLTSVLSTMT